MPTYDYHCDTCERDFEIYMSIAKRNEPINEECSANNCSLKLKISSPTIGYDNFSLTGRKPDEGFRDKLREMKRSIPGNTINVD